MGQGVRILAMSFQWVDAPEEVFTDLAVSYQADIDTAVLEIANDYSPQIADYMKQNHPWQNRTGEAERQLGSEVIELVNEVVIAFGHGVDYGIFLETMQGGRFAIISPALDIFAVKIWADVQGLFR